MAYPYHYLFSFGGTLPPIGEIWCNNIRFVGTGTPEEEYDLEDICQGLMEVMAAGMDGTGTANLGYSTAVRLEWGKFNAIGADGRYASESETVIYDYPGTGKVGTGLPHVSLPQVALAVSWGTVRSRGPASRGRIYVPMPNVGPEGNGRLTTTQTGNIAQAWAAQIDRLNDRAQNVGQERPIAAVVSGVNGAWEPISTVRVGDVVDTQRRRRSALSEIYSSAAVPDSA